MQKLLGCKRKQKSIELFKKYDHFDKRITKNCMNIVKR